jgi:hypothetical protein
VLFQHEFSCYCIENLSFRNTKISTRIYFNTLAISITGVLSVYPPKLTQAVVLKDAGTN